MPLGSWLPPPLGTLAGPPLGPPISNIWTVDKFYKEILLFSLYKPSFLWLGLSRVILERGWQAPGILAATYLGWTTPGTPYLQHLVNWQIL